MKLIEEIESRRDKKGNLRKWGKFLCPILDCNKIVERLLHTGLKQKTCGCVNNKSGMQNHNYKHGESNTRLYHVWDNMKQRCFNPNFKQYKDYGGRGITICPEWTNDYTVFRDWSLSNGYVDNLEIDRIKTNGNYEPSNCRFITSKENQRNKRNNKLNLEIANKIRILYNTGKYTQRKLAKIYGINQRDIFNVMHNKIWV